MATRIVDVSGFDLATGHTAHGELRASASSAAAAVCESFAGASAATSVAVAAAVASSRVASSTLAASATLTAAATVTAPTDISSLLVAGSGTFGAGSIIIPGYDQAYLVTVSNANIVGYNGTTAPTPGIIVTMPEPTTPNAAHSLTIRWVISGVSRRVAHELENNWLVTGQVVEPEESTSTDCVLSYTWDTTAHGWYVSSYTGDVLVREHGPDESPNALPLFFSPEARALGSWSTILAAQVNALEALPSSVSDYLGSVGVVADVVGNATGYLEESIRARTMFDPAWDSGINGLWGFPTVSAREWVSTYDHPDGKILLHEVGHAWDDYCMRYAGTPWGVDPSQGSPNENETVTTYYSPGVVESVTVYRGGYVDVDVYDTDGNVIFSLYNIVRTPAAFRSEQPIIDLYATVADKTPYYVSTVGEFTAQCFMLIWAPHVTGTTSADLSGLIGQVGGQSVLDDFNDYAVSVGVLPSSW